MATITLSYMRLRIIIITVAYVFVNVDLYINYLSPIWGYQGFPQFVPSKSAVSLGLAILFIGIYTIVLPTKVVTYSRFVIWFIFYFMYIPTSIIVAMRGFSDGAGIALVCSLFLSMFFILIIPEYVIRSRFTVMRYFLGGRFKGTKFYLKFVLLFVVVFVAVALFYRDIISFRPMSDVYELREIAANYAPNKTLMAYMLQWLIRDIAPFMIALGLIYKKRWITFLGVAGMLIGYGINGSKFIIFMIPLMYIFYRVVLSRKIITGDRIAMVIIGGMVVTWLSLKIYDATEVSSAAGIILSQIAKRAYAIGGMTLGNYYEFFNQSSLTYYSHIGPVGWFIDYPYKGFSIGQVVGNFQAGTYTYDMSAGFWQTDGIAALWLPGIVLIGIVLGVILAVFNRIIKKLKIDSDLNLLCLSSIGVIWMLADTGITRVLLTGGWPLHLLFVYWFRKHRLLFSGPSGKFVSKSLVSR